jgi:hypothetical protein
MKLDFFGEYSQNGFDDNLFGYRGFRRPGEGGGGSAVRDLLDGGQERWFLGMELRTPVGNRLGHAAVRNAELQLRREQALLEDQERTIALELRSAFTELDRAYVVSRSNFNRRAASIIQLEAERQRNAEGRGRLDLVLDAQRRAVQSEIAFHRAMIDFNLALMKIHHARGTLLDSLQVYLTEGPWSAELHHLACRQSDHYRLRRLPLTCERTPPVSVGPFPQRIDSFPPMADPAYPPVHIEPDQDAAAIPAPVFE